MRRAERWAAVALYHDELRNVAHAIASRFGIDGGDLEGEAMLIAYSALRYWRSGGGASVRTWVHLAVRRRLTRIAYRRSEVPCGIVDLPEQEAPCDGFGELAAVVASLPWQQRRVMHAIYVLGMTEAESARAMHVSRQAVSQAHARAMLTLRATCTG